MTIADLACFSWVNWDVWAGVDAKQYKRLSEWSDRINDRPAVQRGLDVPEPFEMKKKIQTKVRCLQKVTANELTVKRRRAKRNMRRCTVNG